jgi:hypothetical protein
VSFLVLCPGNAGKNQMFHSRERWRGPGPTTTRNVSDIKGMPQTTGAGAVMDGSALGTSVLLIHGDSK